MCTAIRFNSRFFGRTMDFEHSFGEELIATPRGRIRIGESQNRYAFMGIGVKNGHTPLYFDGVNEWGLGAAALNFPHRAVYHTPRNGEVGVSSAHVIAMTLGLCRSVSEAREMMRRISVTPEGADETTPPTPLHWIIADPIESVVVESVADGLRVYDNPVGILTNSPDFPYHLTRLADFSALSVRNPEGYPTYAPPYSRGMGGIGLPGDFSSASRFVRADFVRHASITDGADVSRIFHILAAVSIPHGCVVTDEGRAVSTLYTVCVDLERPTYYLTTSSCRSIREIALSDEMISGDEILSFPIYRDEYILPL